MKKSAKIACIAWSLLASMNVGAASFVNDALTIQETDGPGSFLFFDNGFITPDQDWGVFNDPSDGALTFGTFLNGVLIGEPVGFSNNAPNASLVLSPLGNLGLGTATPGGALGAKLTISQFTPAISFDSGAYRWSLFADGTTGMGFYSETNDTVPFAVSSQADNQSLIVDSSGNVGAGTATPNANVHVVDTSNNQLLVENTSASAPSPQFMFQLLNKSNAKVRFAISSNGNNTWTFDNNPFKNQFSIAKVGTGEDEFAIKQNGDGTFRGRSYAVEHLNTSSRTVKTDFEAIDFQDVLKQVAALPVSQWRYKVEDEGSRHLGPVAEDFLDTFGLGDGRTISTVDASGVALAAIKALHEQLEDKEAEIISLQSQLHEQIERSRDQEARMKRLELTMAKLQLSESLASLGGTR